MTSASTRFFGQPRLTMLTFCFTVSLKVSSLDLFPEIRKLHLHIQILAFEELDRILEIIAVLAGHPDLIVLDLGLHLELGLLDDGNDILGLLLGYALLDSDNLAHHPARGRLDLAVLQRLDGNIALE